MKLQDKLSLNWEDFGIVGLYDHPRSGCLPKLNFFEKKNGKSSD